ncbi:MAG TPA: tetratricopeptide repeat protein [Hyphomicrobiaceae bacterium]|jgi:tetratricopeptide (TPR) repeat protein|nr:tetratricopeptide repeat protein [Hyphomicrobiaceae bacterium]
MRAKLPLALSMIVIWTAATWADDKSDCRDGRNADLKIRGCSALIKTDAKDAMAFYNRGSAYQTKGDVDKAITDFDAAIGLKPDYAAAYENRARAHVAKGDYTRAVADVTKAGELAPKVAVRPKAVPSATTKVVPSTTKAEKAVAKQTVAAQTSQTAVVAAEKQQAAEPVMKAAPKTPDWPSWAPKQQESQGN